MILFGHNFCITLIIYFMFLLNLTNRFLALDVYYNSSLFTQFIQYNILAVEMYVSNRCGVTVAWSRKIWKKKLAKFVRFWKSDLYGKIFEILFRKDSSRHRSTCCVQISWYWADRKSVKLCVTDKKTNIRIALQLLLLRRSRQKSARPSPIQCTYSVPDFIQIGSLSAEL